MLKLPSYKSKCNNTMSVGGDKLYHSDLQLCVKLLLYANIPIAFYTSLIHQRGGFEVMAFLRQVCQ